MKILIDKMPNCKENCPHFSFDPYSGRDEVCMYTRKLHDCFYPDCPYYKELEVQKEENEEEKLKENGYYIIETDESYFITINKDALYGAEKTSDLFSILTKLQIFMEENR